MSEAESASEISILLGGVGGGWWRGLAACLALVGLVACDGEPAPEPPPVAPRERAIHEMKAYVDANAATFVDEAEALCRAAPAPDDDGWSLAADRAAVEQMRAAWRRMRVAYERVEGAVQILFPQLDVDLDARYEHHAELHGDDAPFDRNAFVGMHAVERILWSDGHDPSVVAFERALPRYLEPRTPATREEATQFSEALCARLVEDATALRDQLAPLALDAPTAWRGILGSVEEQAEKVRFAATGQTESRYARHTLADMRANVEGGRAVLDAFGPLLAEHGQVEAGAAIERELAELGEAYEGIDGDALPVPGEGFDPEAPGDSIYGRLVTRLDRASDPRADGSLAAQLRETGLAMGIAPLSR